MAAAVFLKNKSFAVLNTTTIAWKITVAAVN